MTERIPVAKGLTRPRSRAGFLIGFVIAGCLLCLATLLVARAADGTPVQVRPDAGGVQRIALTGGSYFFRPERILAHAGSPIELAVKMEPGLAPHRFVLENRAGKVFADVELSEKARHVRLDLPAGEYLFHCPTRLLMFKSHRERGMEGRLEVLP